MIEFSRDGSTIYMTVAVKGHTIQTKYETGSTLYASLLFDQLKSDQWKETEQFARKMYNEGWDDKTKKRAKKDWFPSSTK